MVNVYVEYRTAQALIPFNEFCTFFHSLSDILGWTIPSIKIGSVQNDNTALGVSFSQTFQTVAIAIITTLVIPLVSTSISPISVLIIPIIALVVTLVRLPILRIPFVLPVA